VNRALRAATIGVLLIAPVALSSCSAGQIPQTSTQNRDKDGAAGTAGAIAVREVTVAYPTGGSYQAGGDAELMAALVNGGTEADQLVSLTGDDFTGVRVSGTGSAPMSSSSALTSVPGSPVGTVPPGGAGVSSSASGSSSSSSASGSASASGSSSSASGSSSAANQTGPTTAATGIGGATGTPTSSAGQGSSGGAGLPLTLPPDTTLYLGKNSPHVFLTGLSRTLTPGQVVRMTFTFQRAGAITVDSYVAGPSSYSPNSSSFNFEVPTNASEPGVLGGGAGESAGGNG
jgi:hypothetical protein